MVSINMRYFPNMSRLSLTDAAMGVLLRSLIHCGDKYERNIRERGRNKRAQFPKDLVTLSLCFKQPFRNGEINTKECRRE